MRAAALLAALCWVWLMRPVQTRAGLPNENSFGFFSVDVGSLVRQPPAKMAEVGDKELSPLLYRGLLELVTRRSLRGFLLAQQALWVIGAALVFFALKGFGVRPALAACGAAVWLTSFLSAITARSFGSAGIVVVFTLAAAWALSQDDLALYSLFGLLTFLGRFEFLPPLLLGLALRRKALERSSKDWERGVFLLATAAALVWARAITGTGRARTEGAAPGNFLWNLGWHLGTQNLTLSCGVPALACIVGTFAALGLGAYWARKEKDSKLAGLFWLCAGWIVWFCAIYAPTSPYLLFNARHHLYFFVPFVLLAGCLAELAARRGVPKLVPLCAALTMVFAEMNARAVMKLQTELRTHDREWQFLLDTQSSWPDACRVASPWWDPRRALLSKLFPAAPAGAPGGCLLVYRSAFAQAIAPAGSPEAGTLLYNDPWRESSWEHRFYTNYGMVPGKLEEAPGVERREPFKVTVGFYRLPEPARLFAAADARLIGATERKDDAPAALAQAAELAKSASNKDRALWRAWDPTAEQRLLCDRGVLEAVTGDKKAALKDLAAATRLEPAFLPAYLSLGELLAQEGKKADALKAFDAGLAASSSPQDEQWMRRLLSEARARLK